MTVPPACRRLGGMTNTGGVLNEAYQRFHRTGPEWGEDQLTNHGPMAVEVLVRRGYADVVGGWVDRYERRLDLLPTAGDRITDENWAEALGAGRRIGTGRRTSASSSPSSPGATCSSAGGRGCCQESRPAPRTA